MFARFCIITACAALFGLASPAARPADILISQLSDVAFGSAAPTTGRLSRSMRFCVSLDRRGRYGLIASGDGADGGFVLSNGIAELPFLVYYSDRVNRPGQALTPGLVLSRLRGTRRKRNNDCNRPNTRLDIVLPAAALEASMAGNYRGTLLLTVTPE